MSAPETRRGFLRGLTTLPLIGGSVAFTARPGAATASAVAPRAAVASPAVINPDAELFDLDAECKRLAAVAVQKLEARGTAYRAMRERAGPVPAALMVGDDDRRLIRCWPSLERGHNRLFHCSYLTLFEWKNSNAAYAWKGRGLETALEDVVKWYGRAGMTPSRIHRWRKLLPIARQYDDRCSEARRLSGHREAVEEHTDAEEALRQARKLFNETAAHTTEGLALHVRRFAGMPVENMPEAWRVLLFSAANLCGVGEANVGWRQGA